MALQRINPVVDRIRKDNVFGAGLGPQTDFGQQNRMANAGVYAPGSFGAMNAAANGTGANVMMAGTAPNAAMLANNRAVIPTAPAQNIFASGMAPGQTDPIHAYAPTGLRDAAINAPINPNDPSMRERSMVWGQGDVMAGYDGVNAQGGRRFSLGQVMPAGDNPVNPANPIAPENLQAANPGMPRSNSKIAGLLAAFDGDTVTGKYLRAQELSRLPVDIEHLKILTAMDKANDTNDIKRDAADVKATAAEQKATAAETGRQTTLAQINEQNKAVMSNIDEAAALAPFAGKVMGKTVGTVFAPKELNRLHALVDSIGGNEMMDYIQRLKAANPAGTIGFRVLDTEAKAMSNVFAAIKNDKIPLEQQDPEFVKEQFGKLKFHLQRMNAIANGKDPDHAATSTQTAGLPPGWSIKP